MITMFLTGVFWPNGRSCLPIPHIVVAPSPLFFMPGDQSLNNLHTFCLPGFRPELQRSTKSVQNGTGHIDCTEHRHIFKDAHNWAVFSVYDFKCIWFARNRKWQNSISSPRSVFSYDDLTKTRLGPLQLITNIVIIYIFINM